MINRWLGLLSISVIWGVSTSRHVLRWRHQTGSELLVVVLSAEREARALKQLFLLFVTFLLADHGRVSVGNVPHLYPHVPPISLLLPSRFLGDRTAPARASGVNPRARLLLLTCLPKHFPPQSRPGFPFPSRAVSLGSVLCFCFGVTSEQWRLKSRDNCVFPCRPECGRSDAMFVFLWTGSCFILKHRVE